MLYVKCHIQARSLLWQKQHKNQPEKLDFLRLIWYYTLKEVFPYVYILGDEMVVASKQSLSYDKYWPRSEAKLINTVDRKILSKLYFDNCDWWDVQDNILKDI